MGSTIRCPSKCFLILHPLSPNGAEEENSAADEAEAAAAAGTEPTPLSEDLMSILKNGYAGESLTPGERNG